MQPSDELRRILLRAFPGCHVAACDDLKGGVSARAVAVDLVLQDATTRRVVVRRPQKMFWGGYSGYFTDPDGHLWEVAHNPHFWVGARDDDAWTRGHATRKAEVGS